MTKAKQIARSEATADLKQELQRKRKPRVERLLKKQAPQITENTKKALIFKGHNTSQIIVDVLKDLVRYVDAFLFHFII